MASHSYAVWFSDAETPDITDPNYGGGVGSTPMYSGQLNNEFDDVLASWRITGMVDYRKQFIGYTDPYYSDSSIGLCDVWIASNTPSPADTVEICGGGHYSRLRNKAIAGGEYQAPSVHLSDTVIKIPSPEYFRFPTAPGEHVFDWDNDPSMANHREVESVEYDVDGNVLVTLVASFGPPIGSEFILGVTPATMFSYYACATQGEAIHMPRFSNYGSVAIWKRRTVNTEESYGYDLNSVVLQFDLA